MPEGPEIAHLIRSLQNKVVDRTIIGIEMSNPKITIPLKQRTRQSILTFTHRSQNARIAQLQQKGKYLVFSCQNNSVPIYMISHLGMTGAFFAVKKVEEVPTKYSKHIQVKFRLDDGALLLYADIRRFGWVGTLSDREYAGYMPIQNIGPNPMETEDSDEFISNTRRGTAGNHPIKRLIMRPEVIAGVGNIYACETLFRAQIHPMTKANDISDAQLVKLYKCIRETLLEALECGGSSISDYVDSEGRSGSFQNKHKIYKKQLCHSCLGQIENIRIDGRSSFFCPLCQ